MWDMQALAFQGDITRVSTLMFAHDVSMRSYPESGVTTANHASSHHGGVPKRVEDWAKINRFHVQCLPPFLTKLKATPDGDGTLLDHTLILWASNMGDGNLHSHKAVPNMLIGGAMGQHKGGRHIQASGSTANLLLTTLHMFGVEKESHRRQHRHNFVMRKKPRGIGGWALARARLQPRSTQLAQSRAIPASPSASARGLLVKFPLLLCTLSVTSFAASSEVANAAQSKDHQTLRALIQKKTDVNLPQSDGTTALHWAAHWADLEAADLLITAGAKVDAPNRDGATPLFLAALNGSTPMVERLLKAGADPNAPVLPHGETALMLACRSGNLDAVKLLLDRGAHVNAKETLRGTTALMWATEQGHSAIISLLAQHGAEVNAQSAVHRPAQTPRPWIRAAQHS